MQDLKKLGLRTNEDHKFCNFMELVQEAAKKKDCKFFLDAGDDHEKETEKLSISDLYGWLIPNDKVTEFENIFFNNEEIPDLFDKFYVNEIWSEKNNRLFISFL